MDTPPLPRRKTIRLQNYDYSQNGAYFVTICTAHKRPLFALSVGATLAVAHLDRLCGIHCAWKNCLSNILAFRIHLSGFGPMFRCNARSCSCHYCPGTTGDRKGRPYVGPGRGCV